MMLERQMIYPDLRRLRDAPFRLAQRRFCAAAVEGTPSITINIGQAGESMIALSIQNTYSHLIRMKDGRFLSSKREDMGTGTTSVRYLVERYHGILKFDYSNGIFEASLLLNPAMK